MILCTVYNGYMFLSPNPKPRPGVGQFSALVQVEDKPDESSTLKFEFVDAETGAALDSITLRNTLRKDRVCSFCYSRTGGAPPAGGMPGACAPSSDTSDLDALYAARQSAEGVEWRAPRLRVVGDSDGVSGGFWGDLAAQLAVEEELDPEDMEAAGAEMDAQSDSGLGAEARGYTKSYRGGVDV